MTNYDSCAIDCTYLNKNFDAVIRLLLFVKWLIFTRYLLMYPYKWIISKFQFWENRDVNNLLSLLLLSVINIWDGLSALNIIRDRPPYRAIYAKAIGPDHRLYKEWSDKEKKDGENSTRCECRWEGCDLLFLSYGTRYIFLFYDMREAEGGGVHCN